MHLDLFGLEMCRARSLKFKHISLQGWYLELGLVHICDPILENGAYCGIYDFELEHTKDEKVTLCRNSFYCINMFYKEIPFV